MADKKLDMNKNITLPSFGEILGKINPKNRRSNLVGREINLVPDVKEEMIKTLKLRNLVFFICIVVASVSVGISVFFISVAAGQQNVVDGNKTSLEKYAKEIENYSDLSVFLTIKDQLGNISSITGKKQLLSRTFGILTALLPTGADTIEISELSINLAAESPTISFDAQANAGDPPYIDYNVLDSFKKSMQYMRYDYGDYVDKEGATIPAYCMVESGADGATFAENGNIYAYWLIDGEGCNPSYEPETDDDGNEKYDVTVAHSDYTIETYQDQAAVKIWRTPQFASWYANDQISLDGVIQNVPHFESACSSYAGYDTSDYISNADEIVMLTADDVVWTRSNTSCMLVPSGSDGIKISDSSNGRNSDDQLVLRFSAVITLAPEVYSFASHHVLAVPPSGRYNVTDSYRQIQSMFGERAADCNAGDADCNTNGGNNG